MILNHTVIWLRSWFSSWRMCMRAVLFHWQRLCSNCWYEKMESV